MLNFHLCFSELIILTYAMEIFNMMKSIVHYITKRSVSSENKGCAYRNGLADDDVITYCLFIFIDK